MRFIETPIFTDDVRKYLDDGDYRALQLALVLRPEQGALIRGGAGLRKLRWGAEGRGKRGGVAACGPSTAGRSRRTSASCCSCSPRMSKAI